MDTDSLRYKLSDLECDMDNAKYKYINLVNYLLEYNTELIEYNNHLNAIISQYENLTKNSNSI